MRTVFADTFYFLALLDSKEKQHAHFVSMRDEGITEALTGGKHFEQAGFTALLK